MGFANVSDLKKDDNGVWRGRAMKDGKTVDVSVDYQGNVVQAGAQGTLRFSQRVFILNDERFIRLREFSLRAIPTDGTVP